MLSPAVALISVKSPTKRQQTWLLRHVNRNLPANSGLNPLDVANAILAVGQADFMNEEALSQLAEDYKTNAGNSSFTGDGTLVGEIANQIYTSVSPIDWEVLSPPRASNGAFPWASILQVLMTLLPALLGGCLVSVPTTPTPGQRKTV